LSDVPVAVAAGTKRNDSGGQILLIEPAKD
jgi:hypothetical protein